MRSKARRLFPVACVLLGMAQPADACPVPAGPRSAVVAVARTGELTLEDGRILRLAGIDWPALDRPGARERLRLAIMRLAAGATATLDGGGRPDRWRRLSGQALLATPDGPPQPLWLQETLLELGLARAWPEAGLDACWPALRAAEERARRAGIGLWSPLSRRVNRVSVRARSDSLSSRAVFEGRVRSVRAGRTALFVNFEGPRAVTPYLLIRQRDLSPWRKEGLDPATFSGKRLRVRGVLSRAPALRLDLSGPMAVEVLE